MAEECTHNCETCGRSCSEREAESLLAPANALSEVKKVVAVVSGKGGVGKSMVTAMLATVLNRRGLKVGLLDADITGPSAPRMFGLRTQAQGSEEGIYPVTSKTGIEVMSINLLLENESSPVVWRGPVIAGAVKQFWTDVVWGSLDAMVVDMPPGTGDVPLTVFQSLPVDGIIVVASPQDLVSMVVKKALEMARMMNIPVIGLVENMSYIKCPDCGKEISVFGPSHIDEMAAEYGLPVLARIPIDPDFAQQSDRGLIELFEGDHMEAVADAVENFSAEA